MFFSVSLVEGLDEFMLHEIVSAPLLCFERYGKENACLAEGVEAHRGLVSWHTARCFTHDLLRDIERYPFYLVEVPRVCRAYLYGESYLAIRDSEIGDRGGGNLCVGNNDNILRGR